MKLFLDAMDNYRRYGEKSSSQDYAKFFAITIMVVDHMGLFFFPDDLWWRAIGRIGFPVWFFMAGYSKPSRPPYILLVLSAMMVFADIVAGENILPINALLSIFFCRLLVSSKTVGLPLTVVNWLFTLLLIAMVAIPSVFLFEYGFQALLFALCGHYCRFHRANVLTPITLVLSLACFFLFQLDSFDFTPEQAAFMVTGTSLVCVYLFHYTIRFYDAPPSLPHLRKPINFLSRNSHYVYIVHFVVFECIAHVWNFR